MHREIARFVGHSAVYTLGGALNRVGAFLLLPVYTRHLSVGEYGALELFSTMASVIMGVLSLGLSHATLRFYFEYRDEIDRRSVVSTNLIASIAIGAVGALLVSFAREPLMNHLFPGMSFPYGLWLVLATLVLELSSQVCLAYLRALERSVFFVAVTVGKLFVQIAANVVLVLVYHAGVEGVLLGNLMAVAAGWLAVAAFTFRDCGARFEISKLTPVLRYSFPFLLATVVGLISGNLDRLYVNGLLSLEALGIYSLAMKLSRLPNDLIGDPFARAYGAFRFSVMDRDDAPLIQARVFRYLALLLAIISLGIVYFGRDTLVLLSAPKFWPAADLLAPLVLASCLQVLTYPLQTGFLYSKASRHVFDIGATQAALTALGSFVLIKSFGLAGACAAPALIAVVGMIQTHAFSQRYFRVQYEVRQLRWLSALTLLFFLLGLPLRTLELSVAMPAKLLLLALFVCSLLASPAVEGVEVHGLAQLWRVRRSGRGDDIGSKARQGVS